MHELAIAQAIAEGVTERAAEARATRVLHVRLRIGDAAGVVPDALRSCFEMVASDDPALAGARLVIESVPHRACCRNCPATFTVRNFVMQCPLCGGWETEVVSGTEMEVRDMEIEQEISNSGT